MKFLLILLAGVAISLTGYSQSSNDYIELTRDVLKIEKKAAITDVMQLSDAESVPFWSLYNEYEGKLYGVQNKRIKIIKDFAANYLKIDDTLADQLWVDYMAFEQELLGLKKTYYKKFKKILPMKKAAQFFQVENKIEKLIDAQLATELPLLK